MKLVEEENQHTLFLYFLFSFSLPFRSVGAMSAQYSHRQEERNGLLGNSDTRDGNVAAERGIADISAGSPSSSLSEHYHGHHHHHAHHHPIAIDDEKPKVLPEATWLRYARLIVKQLGCIAMNVVTLSVSFGITVAVALFIVFSVYELWSQHSAKFLASSPAPSSATS